MTTYRINPSTEELEVHVPGTGWAKAVVSVSSAGVEVGGGGGGGIGGAADVQYIDGDAAPTNPIGTAIVMASGGVMVDVSADNPMPVAATTLPLPTGAATDATLAALNAALGLVGDAIATAGGTGTASAKLRRMTQGLEDLKTLIVLATGTNVIGRVGIDQTTPGTTNLVQLPASQVTSLQNVIANAGTNLNTSTLALESGGNLAALLTSLGAAADAIVAAGAVGSASAKLRRMTQGLEDLKSLIVLATGTNVIGRVGIDQTTPGTTNLVQLPASQVTSLQNVTANAGTNLNTAALALESGGNLAALLTSLGAAADAIVAAGAVGSASAKLRRMTQGLEDLKSLIVLAAGANVIGKVGIDQAIPGTTNLVQLPSAQVTSLQTVTASAGTNLNTSALALESGGNVAAAAAVLGAVADAIVAAGGTGSVSAKLRRVTQGLEDLKSLLVLAAGANIIGKVGIDQTTPGTTNLVQLPTSQVTSLQNVTLTDLPPGASTESTLAALAASAAAEFALFQGGTAEVNQARLTILDDTTRTVPGQAGTATLASVAASVTSVTLAAASVAVLGSSAGRMGLVVVNDSASGTLYLAYKATAAITGASAYTYKIAPGETWTMPAPLYNGAISGIWDVASGAARITALSA